MGEGQTVSVDGRTLALTNLDKVLYPATGTTKAEVIDYYAQMADVLLPHLWMRPITRKRWPDGVGEHSGVFFAKDLPKGTPEWVKRFPIAHSRGTNYYPIADSPATLVWLAQLASLELHVPQWRFDEDGRQLRPDRLVLDLDPGPGVDLAGCAEVAFWVRDALAAAGMDTFPVTSGSKGIHLYAQLDGSLSTEEASALAKQVADALQAAHADRVTAVMRRADRDGKVFLDWSQNNGNKTTITPYSLRGREHPMVAAPRTWEELGRTDLRQLDFTEVLHRVKRDGDLLRALDPPEHPTPTTVPEERPQPTPTTVPEERPKAASRRAAGPDRLATYRSMRDAAKTPEPVPATPPTGGSGRSFVIQEHHARRLHYDFRLEHDGVLVSWAVPKGPPTDPKRNHLAVPTEDHPLEYGSFEGQIPAGQYGGGRVRIWDAGSYEQEKWRDGKEVIVTLHGRPDGGLGGEPAKFALINTGRDWLIHRMAIPATPAEPVEAQRTPAEPVEAHGTPAEPVEAMLATLASPDDLGDERQWAFEMKWDGVRVLAYVDRDSVRLVSRNGRDETQRYPDLVPDVVGLGLVDAVLDGEIVVLDPGGAPSFGLLQPRINLTRATDIAAAAASAPAQLVLFDLLRLEGRTLTTLPYETRRELLEELQPEAGSRVQIPPVFDGDLHSALDASQALRLEGVVAKRRGSTYAAGHRNRDWLKIKHLRTQSVVVGGWRPGNGNRAGTIGALLMGVPDGDQVVYVGRVGTGFTAGSLREAERLLAPLAQNEPSLAGVPEVDAKGAHWVRPELVGEVRYAERTAGGRLRAPVWLGWRTDLQRNDVRVEQ